MMKRVALVSVIALAACGKSGSKGSGDLSSSEVSLLKEVPGGNNAVFGGNYMKMQHFMQSTLGQAVSAMMKDEKQEAWMACFAQYTNMKIAGGLAYVDGKAQMRMVFSGLKLADLQGCATKAGFAATMDPDNKYLSIDIVTMGQTMNQGYLALPSGDLYMRVVMGGFGLGMPAVEPTTRQQAEADAASPTHADADKVAALAGKADRSRTFWFAGSGTGTPIASKVGEVYGSVDLESGIAMDVTVQVADPKMADQAEEGIKMVKKSADQLPGDIKGVIEGLDFSRDGDHLRFAVKVNEAQLKSIMSLAGGGMLGGGRKHHSAD
jgi:hypothetical protein